jgi:pyoverdine/dityrosine biosynthesis protein Dit1
MQPQTQNILNIFERYRMAPTAVDQYEQTGKQILAGRIESFVASNSTIKFAMLGLPFKSTNKRDKVLGDLPDLGEELTVKNFQNFNAEIKQVYAPGVKIKVASDGYVFNDLLGIDDNTVHTYTHLSGQFSSDSTMEIIDLNAFYSGGDIATKRDKLMQHFGYSWDKMEQEILFNPDVNFLYKGMIKFMQEELAWKDFPSNEQRRKAAKKLVREMMLRNEAYNLLVRKELSDHIRLSMHPSVNNGYKYSFKLIPGANTRHSAWHSCILIDGNEVITIHKADAVQAGYELVYKDGQPYNFIK